MYLAVLTAFLGGFFILGYLLLFVYFLVSIPVLHLFIIYVEEPELKRKFGEEYLKYTKKVPRWLPITFHP
jgi:protein-S-isoprenylcysteine O-methyltransferase Ste14